MAAELLDPVNQLADPARAPSAVDCWIKRRRDGINDLGLRIKNSNFRYASSSVWSWSRGLEYATFCSQVGNVFSHYRENYSMSQGIYGRNCALGYLSVAESCRRVGRQPVFPRGNVTRIELRKLRRGFRRAKSLLVFLFGWERNR